MKAIGGFFFFFVFLFSSIIMVLVSDCMGSIGLGRSKRLKHQDDDDLRQKHWIRHTINQKNKQGRNQKVLWDGVKWKKDAQKIKKATKAKLAPITNDSVGFRKRKIIFASNGVPLLYKFAQTGP
jgi:hypothetical protein